MMHKVIRADGTVEEIGMVTIPEVMELIHADMLDTVRLRDRCHVMILDDNGCNKNLPVNKEATRLYHEVCVPETRWPIRGDVVIVPDYDFDDEIY